MGGLAMSHVRRREFIGLLGAAAAWPVAARAQQLPIIGVLDSARASDTVHRVAALRDGLADAGFIDGHNVTIEFRWADHQLDQLPALAAELVRRRVAVIVVQNATIRAARDASSTIPIVFISGSDPISSGLVTSLSRPGGNVTGVSFNNLPLQPKRLGLLHELLPPDAVIALLREPKFAEHEREARETDAAARELARRTLVLNAGTPREIDAAFDSMRNARADALLIGSGPFFVARRRQLAALALRHGIPAISNNREFVMAGGLMSYGASDTHAYRRAGVHYLARILTGAKPGDLPVQMPTTYELVINLVTAKALGLEIPPTLLARADEVIE
jgi:putative tryptophan/tyrosine transport system substrate-binding protein